MQSTSITTLVELQNVTAQVLEELVTTSTGAATVLGLIGDLGAGKTAFVQCLAQHLGVREIVTSPTYVIMRSYETSHERFKTLVHIDAYRIESLAELAPLRFSEVLAAPDTLVCIEWADQIKDALPPQSHYLALELAVDGTRVVRSL